MIKQNTNILSNIFQNLLNKIHLLKKLNTDIYHKTAK